MNDNGNGSSVERIVGYIQFGTIHSDDHKVVGYTKENILRIARILTDERFLYCRQNIYGIQCYGRDDKSPTGVSLIGSIPCELHDLLYAFGKTGALSPTEDLRTS